MAKLVDVFRAEKDLTRRQLPLVVDDKLTMVMDLNSMGLICDNRPVRGKELEEFTRKVELLTPEELTAALEVKKEDLFRILNQVVPCVGCRRSVERLYKQLVTHSYRTLDPISVNADGIVTIRMDKPITGSVLATLFHGHSSRLNELLDSQPRRSKKSHRCLLHTLDSQRSRTIASSWQDIWECMRDKCKSEVVLIDASTLHATLEGYLRKHRFCGECRTKVLRAYALLVEEAEPCKDKGYVSALYSGIKRCIPDKHLHLQTKTDYISKLLSRAEPELTGSRRERHAKTLEIAQEEVLTCLGICVYERLQRISARVREEECTCQVLAAVAVDTLCRSFETAVEQKQGFSQLELLYAELTKEEQSKRHRTEQKKLKRRRRKKNRCCDDLCTCTVKQNEQKRDSLEKEDNWSDNEHHCAMHVKEKSEKVGCKNCKHVEADEKLCNCTMNLEESNKQKHEKMKEKRKEENASWSDNEHNCTMKQQQQQQKVGYKEKQNGVEKEENASCWSDNEHSCCNKRKTKNTAREFYQSKETWSSSEHSHDCGYSSENNNGCCETASGASSLPTTPEGSELACTGSCCNLLADYQVDCSSKYARFFPATGNNVKLSLQQMLEDAYSSDEDCNGRSYLSPEEVKEFESKVAHLPEQREKLRETLRNRFAQLCMKGAQIYDKSLTKKAVCP